MKKLKVLEKILIKKNFTKEAEKIQSLQMEPFWLTEWRNTMRHYGFKNFGRNTKWHKGKSYLEEPMDQVSAEQDIHMVQQAHSPDEEGRRISDNTLNRFMKEFYGENIWIAPREGWRSKVSDSEE